MKTIANVLGVARSHLHERVHRPTAARGSYCKAADEELLPLIRRLVDERPTYGYRRVTALVNRVLAAEGQPAANHKRIFRIMKRHGELLHVDWPAVKRMATESRASVLAKSGFKPPSI